MPLFVPPPAGVYGTCYCTGIPASLLTIELTGGGHIAECYAIHVYCDSASPTFQVRATDGSGVLTFDPSPQAFDIDGTTGVDTTCTMTISNFDAEGITIEWRRSTGGSLIWKATNREHWNPAVRTPLKVLDYDPNAGIGFPGDACLVPLPFCEPLSDPDPLSCCGCDGVAAYAYLVQIDDFGATSGDDPEECQCRSLAGDYIFVGCTGGTGSAQTVDCGSGDFAFDLELAISSGAGTTSFQFTGGPGGTFTGELIGHPVPFCTWVHSGESVTIPMTSNYCDESTITVTPLAISSDGIPVDCNGNPVDITRCPPRTPRCGGTSVWKVSRGCFDGENDTYVYYWTKVSDGCSGLCSVDTGRCYAVPPFVIDSAPMTDAEAAAYSLGNLITSLGVEQDGTCECTGAEYTPPTCVCSGSSLWELSRKPCYELTGVAYYQYYWTPISNDCSGSCTCVARIPASPVLPTDPKSDAEVPDLVTALGTQYESGCTCDAAYVEPDCPPECDCADIITLIASFTIAPIGGAFSDYAGDYTLTASGDCSWLGTNVDGVEALIEFSGGLWSMLISGPDGDVSYAGGSGCPATAFAKTFGDASMPDSITVSWS